VAVAALGNVNQMLGAVAQVAKATTVAPASARKGDEMNYPHEIEKAITELSEKTFYIAELREAIDRIELEECALVLDEKDEAGKPKYSNETARKAALAARMASHADYSQLKSLLKVAESSKALLGAKLERLRGEFKLHLLDRLAVIAEKLAYAPSLS
jgi:hypothetical protein